MLLFNIHIFGLETLRTIRSHKIEEKRYFENFEQ